MIPRRTLQSAVWGLVALAVMVGSAALAAAAPPVQAPTPTAQVTPSAARLRIWWPDDLYPDENSEAEAILQRQWDTFRQTYRSYELEVRRKRSGGLGGILPTLRAATGVAPGALPDLTLMRRADMVSAAEEGLLVPLEDWVPADMLEDLLPGVRSLGEVGGTLYGVPYSVSITHTVYRTSVFSEPPVSFSDILREEPVYLFPAGSAASAVVSPAILLQYLQAGGRLADEEGNPLLDRDPLMTLLQYYATGVTQGIFGPELLEYTQATSYWSDFVAGEADLIHVDSAHYLKHQHEVENVAFGTIPTQGGERITSLNGWMWVLITHDADRQDRARAFFSWMMRASQQAALTEALNEIPSQTRALSLWENQAYAAFAAEMVPSGRIVLPDLRSSAGAVLQKAFEAVLGGAPPGQAADEALAGLE